MGGLEPIVDQLRESVIYPLCAPQLFESAAGLFAAPKGVLLYGPPGCGKTLLAKALAKESGATFINLHVSTLTDKVNLIQTIPEVNSSDLTPLISSSGLASRISS